LLTDNAAPKTVIMCFVGCIGDVITGEGVPLCNAPNEEKPQLAKSELVYTTKLNSYKLENV
jgi:hypothetical protein